MKDMLYIEDMSLETLCQHIPRDSVLFFDTESSFKHDNKLVPMFLEDKERNPKFNFEVHVYAWAVGNNFTNSVIYGHNLKQFINFLHLLPQAWCYKEIYTPTTLLKAVPGLNIWVHNLSWDVEFLKYELNNQKYYYTNSRVNKGGQRINSKLPRGSFNIIENNNQVYGCTITHKKCVKVQVQKDNKILTANEPITINFYDSLKVTNTSLDQIATKLLTLSTDRLKIHGYDYDSIRLPGHVLTPDEQEYLYNDVYILKEWYNQYYKKLNTTRKTASGIAFERICKLTYGPQFTYDRDFIRHFPEVTNYITKKLVDQSYRGGMTQFNRKLCITTNTKTKEHEARILKFKNGAVSLDIVSSYPSILVNKPLPIGNPVACYDFANNDTIKENLDFYLQELEDHKKNPDKLVLLQIAFDGFANNDKNNTFGNLQIGAGNREVFQKHFTGVNSGNEYIHTNILKDGTLIGSNYEDIDCQYRYIMSFWSFELDSMLKSMSFYTGESDYCSIRKTYYKKNKQRLKRELKTGYKILAATVFEAYTGFFAPGILDGVKKKLEGKKTGNKVLETANKTYINSFYGKMATDPERFERELYYNEETEMMEFKSTDVHYTDNKKYYKAMASAVTAWGRCNLRDTLHKICNYDEKTGQLTDKFHNNVLYMDTDSLYTTLPGNTIETILGDLIDGHTLGKWDIETHYEEIKVIGAKKYMYYGRKYSTPEDKLKLNCKCAGLPLEAREGQTFGSFKLGAEIEGKKVKIKTKGGYALIYGKYTICDNIL